MKTRSCFFSRVSVPDDFKPGSGTLAITADVSWLVCEKQCIPGDTTLKTALQARSPGAAGDRVDETAQKMFADARASLPTPVSWPLDLSLAEGDVVARVQAAGIGKAAAPDGVAGSSSGDSGGREVYFFPHERELIDHGAEQKASWSADALEIRVKPHAYHEGGAVNSPLRRSRDRRADRRSHRAPGAGCG